MTKILEFPKPCVIPRLDQGMTSQINLEFPVEILGSSWGMAYYALFSYGILEFPKKRYPLTPRKSKIPSINLKFHIEIPQSSCGMT